jgi:hypothetical protein
MGLKTSPNSFPLLKNKVFNGLSFRNTLCYLDESMEDMKFGICRVNDPVNSSTFGIVYRKACVLEFRYRKSTQNLDINRLPSFEYSRAFDVTYSGKSLMNMRNNSGPSTVSWASQSLHHRWKSVCV